MMVVPSCGLVSVASQWQRGTSSARWAHCATTYLCPDDSAHATPDATPDDPTTAPGYSADELAKLKATQPEGLLHLERKVCTLLDQGEMDLGSIEADMMRNGLTVKQAYTVSVDAILNQCPDHRAALQ
jgi:hypothetical protein